jgi:hypothetical protein
MDKRSIIIIVKFRKLTERNPFASDIYFYIHLSERFPEKAPTVYCHSNVNQKLTKFTYPTLYDNRNILLNLLIHPWQSNSKVTDIIENIPKFLRRISRENKEKIFTYYGEYVINDIYDINEFLINAELQFFKCTIEDDNNGYSSDRSGNLY